MNKVLHNNLINGVTSDYLNINDRSIHYGDGLFETILCNDNKLYYWPQHFLRLQQSAEKLKIVCPQEQVLLDDIAKLLDNNKFESTSACVIKIIVSRGAGERGYKFSKNSAVNRLVLLSVVEIEYSSLLSEKLLSGELYLCEQQASINKNLAGLKHLNRLENVLARNEWNTDHIDGLMLNDNLHVIEGTMSNLFAVKDDQLYTPNLTLSGVNGTMRETIIDLASKNNIKVSVENLTIDDLSAMDGLFISNSLMGIKSVNKLCDWVYNKQNITDKIFSALLETKESYAQLI